MEEPGVVALDATPADTKERTRTDAGSESQAKSLPKPPSETLRTSPAQPSSARRESPKSSAEVGSGAPATPPDGGYGWVVVLCSFLSHVISDGIIYTSGVLLDDIRTYFDITRREMGWLASILIGFTFGLCPIIGVLVNRYGCRLVAMSGGVVCSVGLLLSSLTRNVGFLYFSYGFITACGLGSIFLPSMVIVSQYFEKRRSFAVGLAVCGSGVGTFVFAPLVRHLQDEFGWHGALLVEAGLVLNCSVFGALYRPVRPRRVALSEADRIEKRSDVMTSPLPKITMTEEVSATASLPDLSRTVDSELTLPLSGVGNNYTEQNGRCRSEMCLTDFTPKVLMSETLGGLYQDAIISQNLITGSQRLSLHGSTHYDPPSGTTIDLPGGSSNHKAATLRQRLSSMNNIVDLSIFKNKAYILLLVGNFPVALAFYIPFIFLPDMARHHGIPEKSAAFLISIIGILSTVGRVVLGYISDKPFVNRFFMFSGALTLMGLVIAAFPLHQSYAFLVVNATMYGTCQALCVALSSVVLVDLFGLEGLPTNFGFFMLSASVSFVVGPPLAGYLYDITRAYYVPFAVMGLAMFGGTLLFWTVPCTKEYKESKRRRVEEATLPDRDVVL